MSEDRYGLGESQDELPAVVFAGKALRLIDDMLSCYDTDNFIVTAERLEAWRSERKLLSSLDCNSVLIEVYQQDWMPGFAAFLDDGSVQSGAAAKVALNMGSLMAAVETEDLSAKDIPYVVAESIMHEVMHVLEAWAGVEFSEDRIEALIEKYRGQNP